MHLRFQQTFFWLAGIISTSIIAGCNSNDSKLPIIGERDTIERVTEDGKTVVDTIYHTIPDFSFIDQDSNIVTQQTVEGKIYISDFFFTSCPTICPVMKKQMLKVYKAIKDDPEIMILSHTIDPRHDTPGVLKKYADELGITGNQWLFLTGDKEKIYEIGQTGYLVSAKEDENEPGGFIHNGAFMLIDKNRNIRGMYNGTTDEGTEKLIKDLEKLKAE
jgi:protein SCO1/2